MAAPIKTNDDGVIASINIIPFVDIVLVLLIIFMVTSTAIVKAAIKVDLPQAAVAGSKVESTVNLVLSLDGELLLDGELTTRQEALSVISRMVSKNPRLQAVVSADKGLRYEEIVKLIDLIKQAGVNTFALNIERAKAVAAKE